MSAIESDRIFLSFGYMIERKKSGEMYNEINLEKIDINSDPPAKEPDRQYYFIAKCREWVREFERENGRCPTACVQTFGCPKV